MLAITVNSAHSSIAPVSADDTYVIVRPESDNVFGFDSRQAALQGLRRSLEAFGPERVGRWQLVRAPRRGTWTTVAEGEALLALTGAPGPSAA